MGAAAHREGRASGRGRDVLRWDTDKPPARVRAGGRGVAREGYAHVYLWVRLRGHGDTDTNGVENN